MKTVAESPALNQAIADLSADAWSLLQRLHADTATDARSEAHGLLSRLGEFARCTGVDLYDVPAYRRNTTNWRAIARLAGSAVRSHTAQAG